MTIHPNDQRHLQCTVPLRDQRHLHCTVPQWSPPGPPCCRGGAQAHLDVVVPVVVQVEHAQQLAVGRHGQLLRLLDALAERLAGVLLHLDVEKLPAGEMAHAGERAATKKAIIQIGVTET